MEKARSPKGKFGIYLPEDLVTDLEKCMASLSIRSKSALIREALKLFIVEHRWKTAEEAVGIIGLIYNHEVKGADEALTEIQHEYLKMILSTLHIHLSKEKCMLAIAVNGSTKRMMELLGKLASVKGVEIVKPLLLAAK